MTPAEQRQYGRIGALVVHSRGSTNTGPARAAFAERFLNEVDPERVLPEAERTRRAGFARRAYYTRLALRSAQVRRSRGREPAQERP